MQPKGQGSLNRSNTPSSRTTDIKGCTEGLEKLRRENIHGKSEANRTHYQVGAKVRQTIKELGGTMPEDLPVAESIKIVEKKKRELEAGKNSEEK